MEQLYYFKILTLLKELNKHVHNLFKKKWKEIKKDDWEENPKFGKRLLAELDPKILKELTSKKIQMKQLSEGCSSGWDLLIFSKIFSSKKFEETTINLNLEVVRKIRNKLAHDISDLSLADYQQQSQIIYNSFEALGKSKEEIKEIQKKLEELEKLQVSTKKNPNEKFESLKEKAQKLFQNKKYDEAIDAYQFVLEIENISDDDKAIICCNKAACHYQLFLIYQEDHSIKQGILEAKKSIFYCPLYFKSYYRLALFYELKQKEEKALIYYDKSLTLCPDNEEIKIKLGNLRNSNGKKKREEHLLSEYQPKTREEKLNEDLEKIKNTVGINYNMNDLNETRKLMEEEDPVLVDVNLAHDYRDGSNKIKKDLTMAVSYYSKAASKGNAEGLYNLALLTKDGAGVKQNFKLAIEFLKRAAEMPPKIKKFNTTFENIGVKESQHSLGLFYEEGVYVEKNEIIARSWYEKAVDNGEGFSANNLGLFWMYGLGGPTDLKKAEKLILFAHEKGDPRAKQNLVVLYINLKYPEKALIWHNICLQDNSLSLSYLQFSDSNISMINDMLSILEKMGLPDWEKENGLSYENFSIAQRFDRYNSKNKNLNFSLEKFVNQLEKSQNPVPNSQKSDKNLANRYKDLFDPIHNGSQTALTLRESTMCCLQALDMIHEKNQNIEQIITLLATSIELEQTGCQIPQNDLEEIIQIVIKVLSKKQVSELNKNARICHIHFHMQDYEQMLFFSEESLKFYPKVLYFHNAKGSILSFQNNFSESNKFCDEALKIQGNNRYAVYHKAAVLRILGKHNESIKYYKLFINLAEKDDRKYPEAHYAIGLILCVKKNIDAAEDWYKKGLEAEKIQLSFYLPYNSPCKPYLEHFLNLNIPPSKNTSEENEIDMSSHKKALILEHRDLFQHMKKSFKNLNGDVIIQNTVKPRLNNISFNPLDKFKPIFFNEIDTTKDHVLKGFVLTVVIIDVPVFGFESVVFIIQDGNQDAHFLSIYNLKGTEKEITDDFNVGSEINIYDPYMRIAADGNARIRVDDPETVKILKKFKKPCRVCFKENCSLFCGKCKIASYCSKKCQIFDWKVLDHTRICNH